MVSIKEKKNANAFFSQGMSYFLNRDYELALKSYNEAIRLNPDYEDAYYYRGYCYYKLQDYVSALNSYNEAIRLDPNNEKYIEQKNYIAELKEHSEALKEYSEAIRLNPVDAQVYYNRADCYYEVNEYQLAIADYSKAIKLNPDYTEAYSSRGICFENLGSYESALEDYSDAIRLNPDYAEAYYYRAGCYYKLEKYEYSLMDYERLFTYQFLSINQYDECSERCEKICNLISEAAINEGQYDKANYYFEKAHHFSISNGEFHEEPQEEFTSQLIKEFSKKENELKRFIEDKEKFDLLYEQLQEKNQKLELEIQQKEAAYKALEDKEREMLFFFIHSMLNAIATAPELLKQTIHLLGDEDFETNQKNAETITEMTSLFSTIALADCLMNTFKQSIDNTADFKLAWQKDTLGEASPQWFIAWALRQSLSRIIFMGHSHELKKLLNNDTTLIHFTRNSFIEQVLPLDINQHDIDLFYQWLKSLSALNVMIDANNVRFGVSQIKFSFMFAISSELILNALKYWSGTGEIKIYWLTKPEHYVFRIKNDRKANISSSLIEIHHGLDYIKRLIDLLGSQAKFNCFNDEQSFTAELILDKDLLEG